MGWAIVEIGHKTQETIFTFMQSIMVLVISSDMFLLIFAQC